MHTTLVSPLSINYYPIPNQLYSQIISPTKTKSNKRSLTLSCFHANNQHTQYKYIYPISSNTTTDTNLQHQHKLHDTNNTNLFLDEMYSLLNENNNPKKEDTQIPSSSENNTHRGISSNMSWANLKAKLGQRFSLEGIVSALGVIAKDRHLAVPHVSVKDIRWVDWVELEKRGFRGVVFDKDNTLTTPYSLELWPPLESSLSSCKSVFGDNVAVFSNSAGLDQYDSDGSKARAIEESIGIHVLRHKAKKPAGGVADIEKYFGCESSLLVMVGDRHFTDIVYGNRNGFLTILTEPLSHLEEPFVVKQVRKLEASLMNYWQQRGLKPTCHSLLPQAIECTKVPPPL